MNNQIKDGRLDISKCLECNVDISNVAEHYPHLAGKGVCLYCNHWIELWQGQYVNIDLYYLRIDGHHYQCHVEEKKRLGNGEYRGFAGKLFSIQFIENASHIVSTNKRTFQTNNLWHQGIIPEHFKERLFDNAKFLNEVEWIRVGEVDCVNVGKI